MAAVIFDGRGLAKQISTDLKTDITDLESKLGRKLKLVTIYNPEHKPSRIYTGIKAKKAKELGIEFQVYQLTSLPVNQLSKLVKQLNIDKTVDGIMIQMPLGTENDQLLIDLIDLKKDVDGLRQESGVMPATVRAVIEIYKTSPPAPLLISGEGNKRGEVIVVGNRGLVGSRLQKELKCQGMDKDDWDPKKLKQADVIISTTGKVKLINDQMVKDGVVAIDVGYPEGDFDPEVAKKTSFYTPVPGGVGPVTVAMLFANLTDLVKNRLYARV